MNKNILITGANSFIGSYFVNNAIQFLVLEVCVQENKPNSIDFSNTDVVFHVAAIVHQEPGTPEELYFKVNSDLAVDIAKKAKADGVKQFVFMSTVKVYGENSTKENPWTEVSECNPSDAYGKSKLEAERKLMELNDEGFVVSIIRTPVVYGAGVKGNIQKIAAFVKNQKVIPFKGIDNVRAMVYIGNLIDLITEVIKQSKSGVFLAGDGKSLSTSTFVEYLVNASSGKKWFIVFPKTMQFLIKSLRPNLYMRLFGSQVINNEKTFTSLGLTPRFSPEYGLQEVIESI